MWMQPITNILAKGLDQEQLETVKYFRPGQLISSSTVRN